MNLTPSTCITAIIFLATYAGLAFGKWPWLRLNRAAIAYVGAAAMVGTGMLTLAQATSPQSVDYQTLLLLLGMMIVVGSLRVSGAFNRITHAVLDRVHSPVAMLAGVVVLSGVLSAFLVNDVVCLALTPLVLHLARRLGFDPLPQLVALATASNIGSVGTITGNPQNMIIATQSHISYGIFAMHLMPIALIGLAIDWLVVWAVFHKQLRVVNESVADFAPADAPLNRRVHRHLQLKTALVVMSTVVCFFIGLPIAIVATVAAAIILLSRIKSNRFLREIDGNLLLMFFGLFIVVHGFDVHVVSHWHVQRWQWLTAHPVDLLSVVSAGLSNLVSNVPAVLLMEPVMHALPPHSQQTGWLALAMSSTFAGNLTLLGSVANLIVVERAKHEGVTIGFWDYAKAGIPITLLTLAIGVAWLMWV